MRSKKWLFNYGLRALRMVYASCKDDDKFLTLLKRGICAKRDEFDRFIEQEDLDDVNQIRERHGLSTLSNNVYGSENVITYFVGNIPPYEPTITYVLDNCCIGGVKTEDGKVVKYIK